MTDHELSNYLPVHGDRLRLRKFLQKNSSVSKRKNKLLTVLQEKIEKARNTKKKRADSSSDEESTMRRPFGNKNALKDKRQIEIGWIHKTNQRSKQVRSKTGGGTRKLNVHKDSKKEQIMEEAKKLFFPDGKSPKGEVSKFEFDIWDFSEREVKKDLSVAEMYELTKMPLLRFYLASWEKDDTEIEKETLNEDDEIAKIDEETASNVDGTAIQDNRNAKANEEPTKENTEMDISDIVIAAMEMSGVNQELQHDNDLPDIEPDFGLSQFDAESTPKEVRVTVHRGHLLKEMINSFKSIDPMKDLVEFELILPNGSVENAEDEGGVTRDVLTEFWNSFYDQCTLGTKMKLPYLRHDFGEEEWKGIANIIVFGWVRQGYFPIQLSAPFLEQCMFGSYTSGLIDAFYDIIPEQEANVLRHAILDFSTIDKDELFEILEGHEIKMIPTAANIERIVQEIAHKEIIQVPMFVADSWYPVLGNIGITKDQLASLKSELIPTPKAILKTLCFPESMAAEEASVAKHLKTFIRELNNENLENFLRFCTGSNLFLGKKIKIAFVNVTGLARRPVAHTCSGLLELSKNYDSLPQFRGEFLAVLRSSVWVMDGL